MANDTTTIFSTSSTLNCIVKTDFQTSSTRVMATDANAPAGLAFDADNQLYFADSGTGSIRIASDTGTRVFATGLGRPNGIAFGSDNLLYVADTGANMLKVIDQQGKVRDLAAINRPVYISAHGNDLVVECNDGQISRYDQSGKGAVFHKLATPSTGLAIDAEGNIYFGGNWDDKHRPLIHKISKTGQTSVYMTGPWSRKFDVLGFTKTGYLFFAQGNDMIHLWQSEEMSFARSAAYPGYAAVRRDFNFPPG
ncbi:hypothetical protein ACO0LL_21960 [Undibacterium sp. TC4M20W]